MAHGERACVDEELRLSLTGFITDVLEVVLLPASGVLSLGRMAAAARFSP